MSTSKIEQLIEEIYEFIESCKMQPLSSTKVIVPRDELYDLLDELRLRTPDEIKRYQKIVANREAIMNDAEEQAANIVADARERTNALIEEHEIMQQAYYQANQMIEDATKQAELILKNANDEAHQIQTGALHYTEDMLSQIERIVSDAYDTTKIYSDKLVGNLKEHLEVIISNKKELSDQLYPASESQSQEEHVDEEQITDFEDEFSFDENTFIEDLY